MKSSSPMNTKKEEESEENLSSTNVEGVQAGRSPQGEQKQEVTVVEGIDVEEKQFSTTPIEENQSSTVVEEKMKEVTFVEGIDAEEKQSSTTPIMDKRSTASMKKLEKYLRKQAAVV